MAEPAQRSLALAPVPAAAMVAKPGLPLLFLFRRFFRYVDFPEAIAAPIRAAAQRGPLVYVLGNRSYIDFLYFNYALARFGLPLAQFANGVRTLAFHPLRRILSLLGARRSERPAAERLVETVTGGQAALVFMRPPRRAGRGSGRGDDDEHKGRLMEALVEAQKRLAAPIQLVPLVLIWGQRSVRPGSLRIFDRLFGAAEEPGRLRALVQFLRFFRNAVVKVPEPLDLGGFLEAEGALRPTATEADRAMAVRRLRFELSGRLERERRVVLGPPRKPLSRLRVEVIGSRQLRRAIEEAAKERGTSLRREEKRANDIFKEIAAHVRPSVLAFANRLLEPVWSRIYDGLDIDEGGLERVREAARKGPLIILPSHKSHVDYLVLSYVFGQRDLVPPHIAAGVNLSFWPLGFLFRSGGAFFIRRSFKGDRLYAAVLRAYMRKILREGYNVEFFLEGGRSRTGKVLPPKFGLLSMVADLALQAEIPGAHVVPVSIGYEKVIEEKSYAHELAGGEKKKEDVRGLLGVGGVLASRYGRVSIEFDEPLPLAEFLLEHGAPPPPPLGSPRKASQPLFDIAGADARPRRDSGKTGTAAAAGDVEAARRAAVARLGHRVVWGISRVTTVTPTALVACALLASVKRGVARPELLERVSLLAQLAHRRGARLAAALAGFDVVVRVEAVDRAIELLADDGDLVVRGAGEEAIYLVPDERRSRVDFYKNNAINHFVAESLLAGAARQLAGRAGPGARLSRGELRRRTLEASRLLKLEFVYRVGATFDVIFADTLRGLCEAGWLAEGADAQTVEIPQGGAAALELLASLSENFIEGYWLVARSLGVLEHGPMARKDLLRRLGEAAERAFLLGEITRRESGVRSLQETALVYFRETGVLVEKDRKLALATEHAEPGERQAVVASIEALLAR